VASGLEEVDWATSEAKKRFDHSTTLRLIAATGLVCVRMRVRLVEDSYDTASQPSQPNNSRVAILDDE
jgi:hypothetical protein